MKGIAGNISKLASIFASNCTDKSRIFLICKLFVPGTGWKKY